MNVRDLAALIVLAAVWGASFLFIRVAAPAIGPFPLMGTRVVLAALALLPFVLVLGRFREVRERWRQFLFVGVFNAAIPFSLIAFAETEITASLAAILNSMTVLFSAVVAAAWFGDPLTSRRILGVVLGVSGVAVLVGLDPLPLNGAVLVAVGAMLLGSFCYALGGNYVKRTFSGVRPLTMAFGQQAGAAALLVPLAVATAPGEAPSTPVAASALALALLSTAFAYLLFFALIARVGATSTLTVTFLSPGFGVLFGVVLLDEPLGLGTLLGLGIVLFAVALVTGVGFRRAKG
ncbi:MAG: DMT family transporter [Actinomycetota bacterium]|nr:DMT family transporter [Actinomycetota bacterium]